MDANNTQEIKIDLGSLPATAVTGRILQSGKLQDHNSFENPGKINPAVFNSASVNGNNLSVKLPPFSVVVLALK